ncbi:hypothetical protein HOLleu_35002 [Holothuria leucospilota]|uniref:Uncharacterized protein n=1 Tax=Holothuria leucospilota TaxID=206669 RepID=A0A9Q0YLX4_HOLLE|nr:hypothetical protein HOLleu_35002 [Holothuria leucospilota]
MRGSGLQKQNTLMHQQLKSFEKTLKQAEDYHNQDNLYKLISPIIPAGVHIISFDGLQRIVGQSRISKAGRKIPSQTSLYFRAFLDDLLQFLDHLHQMKDNFDERIYSVLFEYYYEIVFEDVKTSNHKKQTIAKRNLMKVFDLPKYAKFRKNYSKEFVDEVAADCEHLSEIMMSLQILVRKWGQLFEEGDIDVSLFSSESQIDLDKYPNCDAFEALLRFIPDVLHKSKQAHTLAYNWWCLSEKIRKKLTGKWKPKTSPQNTLEVPMSSRVSSRSSSHSWTDATSGGNTPHEQQPSRVSHYHVHCAPRTKNQDWEYPTPSNMPSKLRRKDTFTYVPKTKNRKSWIPRKIEPKRSPQNQPGRKKSTDQRTQTQQRRKDACTSPMVAMSDILTGSEHSPDRKEQYDDFPEEIEDDYSYSEEFDDDDNSKDDDKNKHKTDGKNRAMPVHQRKHKHGIEDRMDHLTFDIKDNVNKLEKETKELEEMTQHDDTRTLSAQVERAIQDIESLQRGLQDIEMEKEKLKGILRDSEQSRQEDTKLMEDLEVLESKLQNLAGIARVNSYRQQLLASDMDLALQLRGTFTRYNQEVRGKIKLLEKLIQEERREQMRLEREIREMMLHNQNAREQDMSLQSVTSASTPDIDNKLQSAEESSLSNGESNNDETDDENLYEADPNSNKLDQDVHRKESKLPPSKGKPLASSESSHQSATHLTTSNRAPHLFNPEKSTLSPLQEEPSNHNSAASRLDSNIKKRVDSPSPSPKMYDNKRDKVYVDPAIRLPKIAENSQMVQQI